jgi:SAM-dependent methyltransferase
MGLRDWMVRQSLSDRRSGSIASKLRHRRWLVVQSLLRTKGTESVLDVGGTDKSWWFVEWNGKVVRCNLDTNAASQGLRVTADGCHLPFADQSFDVAFSNSVIEHLGSFERQVQFAAEFRRVARRYFLQTPNRWFIIEPHYLFPLFQFLPAPLQRWLHTHFNIGTFKKTDPFGTIRLMTRRELERLFPEGQLVPERLGFLVKSWYMVFTGPDRSGVSPPVHADGPPAHQPTN